MPDPGWMMIAVIGHLVGLVGAIGYGVSTLAGGLSEAERVQKMVWCPGHEMEMDVAFLVRKGVPYEVAECPAFPEGYVTCRKHCLELAMAA